MSLLLLSTLAYALPVETGIYGDVPVWHRYPFRAGAHVTVEPLPTLQTGLRLYGSQDWGVPALWAAVAEGTVAYVGGQGDVHPRFGLAVGRNISLTSGIGCTDSIGGSCWYPIYSDRVWNGAAEAGVVVDLDALRLPVNVRVDVGTEWMWTATLSAGVSWRVVR